MNKQNVVYTYNAILFSLKKEWNYDTCNNIDELWIHYAKWNKPGTKTNIVQFYLGWVSSSQIQRLKVEYWLPGAGGKGEWGVSV